MDATGWRKEIGKALDPGGVVQVVRAFLEALDSVESGALPVELRNAPPKTPDDVSYWALVLTRAWLDSGSGGGNAILMLGRVSLVFADASRRLAFFGRRREMLERP
jgi:hypothetical protein